MGINHKQYHPCQLYYTKLFDINDFLGKSTVGKATALNGLWKEANPKIKNKLFRVKRDGKIMDTSSS